VGEHKSRDLGIEHGEDVLGWCDVIAHRELRKFSSIQLKINKAGPDLLRIRDLDKSAAHGV
jgi:hypothetical protein